MAVVPSIIALTEVAGGPPAPVAKPAGGTAGDSYVVMVFTAEHASPPTVTAPGFIEIGTGAGTDAGSPTQWGWFSAFFRTHTGTEGSSFSVSTGGGWTYVYCLLVRGAGSFQHGGAGFTETTTDYTVPGVTVASDDSLGIIELSAWDAAGIDPFPTGGTWTLTDVGPSQGVFLYTKELDAGATGTINITGAAGNLRQDGFMVVANPGVPPPTPVRFVQANSAYTNGPLFLNSSAVAGNTLVAWISDNIALTGVTLPAGWQKQPPVYNASVPVAGCWWVYPNHPGGTVTAAISGSLSDAGWSIHEYSDADPTSPLEDSDSGQAASGSTWTVPALTVVEAGAVVVGVAQEESKGFDVSVATSGFTQRTEHTGHVHATFDDAEMAAGSVSVTGGLGVSAAWIALGLSLRTVGAAPGAPTPPAIDASSPPFVTHSTGQPVTASFTPPVGSMLLCAMTAQPGGTGTAATPVSTGLTFSDLGTHDSTNRIYWWVSSVVSAATARTVAFNDNSGLNGNGFAKVWVLTGAGTPVIGTSGSSTINNATITGYTSTIDGSRGFCIARTQAQSAGATSADAYESVFAGGDGEGLAVYKASGTDTAGTAVTFNLDASGSAASTWKYRAVEVPPYAPPVPLEISASGTGTSSGSAAIVRVTLPTPAEFFGAGTFAALAAGTSITATLPASTTAGMVAVVAYMYNAATAFTTPSGWTVLGTAINSANQSSAFFVKRLTGGDANPATTVTTMSATNGGYGRVYVWNHVSGTAAQPLEDVGNAGTPTLNTTPLTSAVTTDGPSRVVASIVVVDDDNAWASGMPPAGWTNIPAAGRVFSTTGGDAMFDAIQLAAGASGTVVAAATIGTQAASDYWRTITFALAPSRLPLYGDGSGATGGSAAITITAGAPPGLAVTAAGTGQSAGSANFQVNLGVSSTGTGQSAGSVALVSALVATASGTGTSAGQATLRRIMPLASSGTGQTTGSAVFEGLKISASGTGQTGGSVITIATFAVSASGTGTTTGSAAVSRVLPVTASGTGTSTGQATLRNLISLTATGTGTSAGSALFEGLRMSASGTGQTAGSVALTSRLVLSSTGTGTSAGSAAISRGHPLSASGIGTSTGSVAISLATGSIDHSMSSSGLMQSAGSVALISNLRLSASGTGVSGGQATLRRVMPMAAFGSGFSDGSVSVARRMPLVAQGAGQSGGSAILVARYALRGVGTGLTTGRAEINIGGVVTMSASGLSQTLGRAVISLLVFRVDLGLTVGEIRAVPRFIFGPMLPSAAAVISGFSPITEIDDFTPVNEVGEMEAFPPISVGDFADGAVIGDLEAAPPVTVEGFSPVTSVGPFREDK